MRLYQRIAYILILVVAAPLVAAAAPSAPGASRAVVEEQIIAQATAHYKEGLAAWQKNEPDRARREWNAAVDLYLESSVPMRESERLMHSYREMVETINHVELSMETAGTQLQTQIYVPSPDEFAQALEAVATVEGKPQIATGTNAHVDVFLRYYTSGRGKETMRRGLTRANGYRLVAEQIFREEGVPTELVWLAQVESGWQATALSPVGALGVWQFMPATGQRFGLRQNGLIDERMDFLKSTRAAARYLKFLLNRYDGNWPLAIGAYNCGEGRMDQAIARAGVRDFWVIRRRGLLPTETANYVPSVLAAILIASNPGQYELNSTAT